MSDHQRILADLRPGEELIWHEEPAALPFLFEKGNLTGLLLGLAFLALSAFWPPAGGQSGLPLALFGALLLGLYFLRGFEAVCTHYAITNKRLIILHPAMLSTVISSYYPLDIDFVKKKRNRRGAGSVIFGAVRERKGKGTHTVEIGFFGIDDVDAVEALILNLRNPKKPAQPSGPAGSDGPSPA